MTRGDDRRLAGLTLAEGGARLLTFGFYLMAARALTVADFGVVRTTIAFAAFAFFAGQVLVTALLRELGAARGDTAATGAVVGTTLVVGAAVSAAGAGAGALAASLGAVSGTSGLGLVTALLGLAAFQLYYAVARGLGRISRAVVAYLGASVAQLVAFGVLVLLVNAPSATAALIVYGVSAVIWIVVVELRAPLIRGLGLAFRQDVLVRLFTLAKPLLAAEAGWLMWLSADQVWVASRLSEDEAGLYGAAKTLVQIFVVLPIAATGLIVPRVAELRAGGHDGQAIALVGRVIAAVTILSVVVGAAVLALRTELLEVLFGDTFGPAVPALAGLVWGMVLASAFMVLTSAAVAWGRPHVYAVSVLVAGITEIALLAGLPARSLATTGWTTAASMAAGLTTAVLLLRHPAVPGRR